MMLLTWGNHDRWSGFKIYAPAVAAVEVATIAIAFLRGMRIRLNFVSAALGALLILAWVTALGSPHLSRSVIMTGFWTIHLFFGFSASRLFSGTDLAQGFLAGFLAAMALVVVLAATAPPDFQWVGQMPGFGNPRSFAIYAAAAIGFSVGLLASGAWWSVIASTSAAIFIFWSGSRGAVMAAAICLLAGMALFPAVRRPRVWATIIGSLLAGAGIAQLLGSPEQLKGTARIWATDGNGREELWRDTIEFILERPWFGYGEGQTEFLTQTVWAFHPHNIFLQILLAWGIVGLCMTVFLAGWAARETLRGACPQTLPPICAMLAIAAYSLVDGSLYSVESVATFAACLGIACRQQTDAADPVIAVKL